MSACCQKKSSKDTHVYDKSSSFFSRLLPKIVKDNDEAESELEDNIKQEKCCKQ
jgi:hypothetical protein